MSAQDAQPPPVPPEHAAIAAKLEAHAQAVRDIGRYGRHALGEGEHVYDALWAISNDLVELESELDDLADRDAARVEREELEGIGP